MEMLLAALLMLWGNLSSEYPDLSIAELAEAVQRPPETAVSAPAPGAPEAEWDEYLRPVERIDPQPEAPAVKGLYATAHSAGGARLEELLRLIDRTELNALVIDIKDDYGYMTYDPGNPELEELGTVKRIIPDIGKLMNRLEEHGVYPIARIVVFKDTVLANKRPDLSFKNPDGTVWDNGKESFVNPYRKEIWNYNVAVAKEAVKAGFKEIQFDYVRFPEGFEKRADTLIYDRDERTRINTIAEFVKYARDQLAPLGARVSVDIFGYAASVPAAEGIGQDFVKISQNVDVISPMIYPSHYSGGWFGLAVPDREPYLTVSGATKDTLEKLQPLEESGLRPIIRPWIQDFTATWVKGHIRYGAKEIEAQIRALRDHGINEYLLWNAGNKYTADADFR